MIRIAITPAAFEAISATLALGTVAIEPERAQDGSVHIWLDPSGSLPLSLPTFPQVQDSRVIS